MRGSPLPAAPPLTARAAAQAAETATVHLVHVEESCCPASWLAWAMPRLGSPRERAACVGSLSRRPPLAGRPVHRRNITLYTRRVAAAWAQCAAPRRARVYRLGLRGPSTYIMVRATDPSITDMNTACWPSSYAGRTALRSASGHTHDTSQLSSTTQHTHKSPQTRTADSQDRLLAHTSHVIRAGLQYAAAEQHLIHPQLDCARMRASSSQSCSTSQWCRDHRTSGNSAPLFMERVPTYCGASAAAGRRRRRGS